MRLTLSPRLSSRQPIEAAARPLPKEDTTPPVTKMYFADIASSLYFGLENCAGWRARSIMAEIGGEGNVENRVADCATIRHIPPICLRRLSKQSSRRAFHCFQLCPP